MLNPVRKRGRCTFPVKLDYPLKCFENLCSERAISQITTIRTKTSRTCSYERASGSNTLLSVNICLKELFYEWYFAKKLTICLTLLSYYVFYDSSQKKWFNCICLAAPIYTKIPGCYQGLHTQMYEEYDLHICDITDKKCNMLRNRKRLNFNSTSKDLFTLPLCKLSKSSRASLISVPRSCGSVSKINDKNDSRV